MVRGAESVWSHIEQSKCDQEVPRKAESVWSHYEPFPETKDDNDFRLLYCIGIQTHFTIISFSRQQLLLSLKFDFTTKKGLFINYRKMSLKGLTIYNANI